MSVAPVPAAEAVGPASPALRRRSGPTVTGGGSTFAAREIHQWRTDVARPPQELSVAYVAQGSTFDSQQYATGALDFGVTDIPLSTGEPLGSRSSFVHVPISAGGIGFQYNLVDPSGERVTDLKLTRRAACRIFTVPGIRWNDPDIVAQNPRLAGMNRDIRPVVREDSAGTSYWLSEFCIQVAGGVWSEFIQMVRTTVGSQNTPELERGRPVSTWPNSWGRVTTAPGADGVANAVADPTSGADTIAYNEAGLAGLRGLPNATVQNGAGAFIAPEENAVSTGLHYATPNRGFSGEDGTFTPGYQTVDPGAYFPAMYSYAVAQTTGFPADKGEVLTRFLCHAVTTGQEVAVPLRYAPLSNAVVALALRQVAKIPGFPGSGSCGREVPPLPLPVFGGGSSFAALELHQWRADVARPPYSLDVNYVALGSSLGRQQFAAGTLDFAVSDIPFQPGESTGRPFVYVPISAGGIGFMYNLTDSSGDKVTDLKLTRRAACRIFTEPGMRWDDSEIVAENPRLAGVGREIRPVVRQDGAGTSYGLSEFCIAVAGDAWSAFIEMLRDTQPGQVSPQLESGQPVSNWPTGWGRVSFGLGAGGVANAVADPVTGVDSIAYNEAGFAAERGIPNATVQNAAGAFTAPEHPAVTVGLAHASANRPGGEEDGTFTLNYAAADAATYFPSIYSYAIAPTAGFPPDKGEVLTRFLCYAVTKGQDVAVPMHYAPLSSVVVSLALRQIAKVPGFPGAGQCAPEDPLQCQGQTATILGTMGDDVVAGTRSRDVIVTMGGNDSVASNGGDDLVCAGDGDDRVSSGTGQDVVWGGDGVDRLVGGPGHDDLQGDAGDDWLLGLDGDDNLTGGDGIDTCAGGQGKDSLATCDQSFR